MVRINYFQTLEIIKREAENAPLFYLFPYQENTQVQKLTQLSQDHLRTV